MRIIKTAKYKVSQEISEDPVSQVAEETPVSPQLTDMSRRPLANPKLKNQLQKTVYSILKPTFFEKIPLGAISEAFKTFGVTLLDEDGSPWSGLLLGNRDCGDERAKDQHVEFDLGYNGQLLNYKFVMSWCRMPSGKMEIIGYIS